MKSVIPVLAFIILSLGTSAQEGIPYISYFNENVDIATENWSVCQDSNNIMLFANRKGLLSFDGHQWRLNSLNRIPTCIEKSPYDNRLYMGSDNSYGILEKNREGKYIYNSLSGDSMATGLITDIIFTDTTVIFYSESCISVHLLDEITEVKRWYSEPEQPFTGMIAHRGKLFFNVREKGLYRIECDTLFPIVTGYMTKDREILFSLPFNDEMKLIGTSDNRLQLFDRILYHDYEISNPEYLEENILSGAALISDSLLALSTLYGGTIVADKETGKEIALLNYQNGLPDDEIYAIGTDNNKGLWLTHGYGICRVDFQLPVSNYSHYPGLEGVITALRPRGGTIYAGTNEGLYFLDKVREYDQVEVLYRLPPSQTEKEKNNIEEVTPEKEEKPVKSFFKRLFGKKEVEQEESREETTELEKEQPVKQKYGKKTVSVLKSINYVYRKIDGIENSVKQLTEAGNSLLTLTSSGIYHVEKDKAELILSNRNINFITPLNEHTVLAGTDNGLLSLSTTKDGWLTNRSFSRLKKPAYNAVLRDSSKIWLGSDNSVLYLEISWPHENIGLREYSFPAEYPVNYLVEELNDSIYAFAETGIYKYHPGKDTFMVYVSPALDMVEGETYDYLLTGGYKPFIKTGEHWKCIDRTGEGTGRLESLLRLFDDPGLLSADKDNYLWLADNHTDIYRIQLNAPGEIDSDFKMNIKGISSADKIFYELDNPVFDPDEKAISINMNAPYFLKETSTLYQYIIEELMNSWSGWNSSPQINLFLESGDYTVRFRAMNILGELSEEKSISFSIKPPFTRSVLFYVIAGLALAGLFVLIIIVREKKLRHDKKILEGKVRQRTVEIEEKRHQIEKQRDEIMSQKEEITSSITYASRIQTAMLSDKKLFREVFSDYFILFKPRDIVSGDFYWVAGNKNTVYFTAADCTGHGVPGAFMSMLGISLLNEITSDGERDLSAPDILDMLRHKVILSLSHTNPEDMAVDGLDIAFCKYNRKKKVLQYAGAFNPLYHYSKGKLHIYKADRMPVGYHSREAGKFTGHEIKILPGDSVYLFSDGYADQFGGPDDKKYSKRKFKSLINEISDLPMDEQHSILENRFMQWKGNKEQLDDVIVMGIRF